MSSFIKIYSSIGLSVFGITLYTNFLDRVNMSYKNDTVYAFRNNF